MASPNIYEVRNYYLDPEVLVGYKKWLFESGAPSLKMTLPRYGGEVVGIWFQRPGVAPTYAGTHAKKHSRETNVTWIIRWQSAEASKDGWSKVAADPDFLKMLKRREDLVGPNLKGYMWA